MPLVSMLFDDRRSVQRRTLAGQPYYIVNESTYTAMLQLCAWFIEQKRSEMAVQKTAKRSKRSKRA